MSQWQKQKKSLKERTNENRYESQPTNSKEITFKLIKLVLSQNRLKSKIIVDWAVEEEGGCVHMLLRDPFVGMKEGGRGSRVLISSIAKPGTF